MELAMGRVINCQKEWDREVPWLYRRGTGNQRDARADVPFKTRFQLLGRGPFGSGEVVPMVKFQEVVQVLAFSGRPSVSWFWPRQQE